MGKIRKAVFPVAGLGTRFLPATKAIPKEMLPIGGRPMIFYAIQEAILSGIEELYIIINSRKDTLHRYLESEDMKRDMQKGQGQDIHSLSLTFIDQPKPEGSGDAIYRARELIGEEPFALMMPDFIFFGDTPALRQLIPIYERFKCDVTELLALQREEAERFGNVGIVQGEEEAPGVVAIRSLSSKSSDPLILNEDDQVLKAVPRWILGPHFFSYLEKTKGEGEWNDTPALQLLCTEREVRGKVLQGRGFDVGQLLVPGHLH